MNFSGKFGSASTIWYPASGRRESLDGSLRYVGGSVSCWSASPVGGSSNGAYILNFYDDGCVETSNYGGRSYGFSVRCVRESK